MKNKLTDLNNHLFAQLERLSDEDITAVGQDVQFPIDSGCAAPVTVSSIREHVKAHPIIRPHGTGLCRFSQQSGI